MNYWLIVFAVGSLTYFKRASFVLFLSNWEMPNWLMKSLRYVPVTIFPALIAPLFFMTDGQLDIALTNPKIFSGMAALLVAWWSKNLLLTIVVGMIVLWGVQWLVG